MLSKIKGWLNQPLTPNTSVVNLTIYIGILFVIAWLWSSVIGGIVREVGKEVAA